MQGDITFWGITIPGGIAAGIAFLVTSYLNQRNAKGIKKLESRLRKDEEAFRLLHSPRVSTAVKLWSAFCDFERSVRLIVSPVSLLPAQPMGQTYQEEQKASQRLLAEDAARRNKLVGESWEKLKAVRDEAEVLLDGDTFVTFEALYRICDGAFTEVWAARQTGDEREVAMATGRALKTLDRAEELRAKAVSAIRSAIAS